MKKKTVKDADLKGKRVLLRVDYNVPMENGVITDDLRIAESLPTICYILEQGGAVILLSHMGRPKGKWVPEFSLRPIAPFLQKQLNQKVRFVADVIGQKAQAAAREIKPKEVVLLENLRYYAEEEANDPGFVKQLAALGDMYVNDAFSVDHRAHASTAGLAGALPGYAGLSLAKEVDAIERIIEHPKKPLYAIVGGAKVSDKISLLANLLPIADKVFIGGGMGNTFLAAKGYAMEKSLVEKGKIEFAKEILAGEYKDKIRLPQDLFVAESFSETTAKKIVPLGEIPAGWGSLDIGPATIKAFSAELADGKTILWNGPMGAFELEPFAEGTKAIAVAVANTSGYTVIGGGDSASAIQQLGLKDKISHVSTGGGAFLQLLGGKTMPGIDALQE